jgi:hypothetical protein
MMVVGSVLAALAGCGAPNYTYAADTSDHAYFRVPSSWQQVDPHALAQVQNQFLTNSAAGQAGGSFIWSRAYSETARPALTALLIGSQSPTVYASVQSLHAPLRAALSYDYMRNLLFPVTAGARQAAASAGEQLTGFNMVASTTITASGGVRGIRELFEYDVNGLPDAFYQTVLTNGDTTKLYLLLVQCYQDCFISHEAQIKAVVDSFTVRGP